jgi:HK97 family phage prohead protease
MLHKDFNLDVKAVSDAGVIEGYGSVFGGPPDLGGDIVLPGAFADTLAEHKRKGTMPLMFFGHKATELTIGNWTDVVEDGKGLWVHGQLDMEDPFATKIQRKLKRKEMRGLSIGYDVKSASPDPKRPGVRVLEKLDLWEVSIVNLAMQPRAAVDTVKSYTSAGHLPSLPQFEEFLREAGFSKTQATAIAGKGLAHLLRSESGNAIDPVELTRKLRSAFG